MCDYEYTAQLDGDYKAWYKVLHPYVDNVYETAEIIQTGDCPASAYLQRSSTRIYVEP